MHIRQVGFISANLAQKITGFSEKTLSCFGRTFNMFEHDSSAARGKMAYESDSVQA
jgi:CRISPR-associated protein Csd2